MLVPEQRAHKHAINKQKRIRMRHEADMEAGVRVLPGNPIGIVQEGWWADQKYAGGWDHGLNNRSQNVYGSISPYQARAVPDYQSTYLACFGPGKALPEEKLLNATRHTWKKTR